MPRAYAPLRPGGLLLCCPFVRPLPHCKLTFYAPALRHRARQRERDALEVLFVSDETVSECARSNVFFIDHRNEVHTASDEFVLLGVTRDRVLGLCRSHGVAVHVRPVPPSELPSFAGCFITSTGRGVAAVEAIEALDGQTLARYVPVHPVVERLSALFGELVEEYVRSALLL